MTAECPICYIPIEYNTNCVVTECGHKFHCSCLMTHCSTNGFSCPYCRAKTATNNTDYDDDNSNYQSTIESEDDDDTTNLDECMCEDCVEYNILKCFRMFYQRIEGEEVEEEYHNPIDEEDNEETEEDNIEYPSIEYIFEKLIIRGYDHNKLLHYILMDYETQETNSTHYSNLPGYTNDYRLLHGDIADIIQIYNERLEDPRRRNTYTQNLVN